MPFFEFNGEPAFSGAQEVATFEAYLKEYAGNKHWQQILNLNEKHNIAVSFVRLENSVIGRLNPLVTSAASGRCHGVSSRRKYNCSQCLCRSTLKRRYLFFAYQISTD